MDQVPRRPSTQLPSTEQAVVRAERLGHRPGGYLTTGPPPPAAARVPPPSLVDGIGQVQPDRVQRDVGFEIEMLVAADIDGQEAPEKVVHYEDRGLELTIDHGGETLITVTRAIQQLAEQAYGPGRSPTGVYHSILEIVTPHQDVATETGKKKALNEVRRASDLALDIFNATGALRRRMPLARIVSTASPLQVSLDVEKWKVPQVQTLDAHIQASVGIDLAQTSTFLGALQDLQRSRIGQSEETLDYTQGMADAARIGQEMTDELRALLIETGQGTVLGQAQDLENLRGLLTTLALYLTMGNQTVLGIGSNWKNFVPVLSRVDLATVFNTSLTPAERSIFKESENRDGIAEMLFDKTRRFAWDPLLLGKPMLYNEYPVPTCDTFVHGVFTGTTDGVAPLLKEVEDFNVLQPEGVGPERRPEYLAAQATGERPADHRRQGNIFEMRVMKQRKEILDQLEDAMWQIESGRYSFNSWYAVCEEIIDMTQQLNRVALPAIEEGVEDETQDEIEARQRYEEYLRQRDDEL